MTNYGAVDSNALHQSETQTQKKITNVFQTNILQVYSQVVHGQCELHLISSYINNKN